MKKILMLAFAAAHSFMLAQAQGQQPQPLACPTNNNGTPWTPNWTAAPGILIAPCPEDIKVGIGTSDPGATLDVEGTTQTYRLAVGVEASGMTGRFHLKASGLSPTNDSPIFLVENTQRKLLQLNNQGLLHAREVKVDLETVWPDYVFNEGYNLLSLAEVEKYIRREGHLPNIPCAADLETNGLELGLMNKRLMEKVEELTLYLIDQDKRLQEQQKRIEELEAQAQKGK